MDGCKRVKYMSRVPNDLRHPMLKCYVCIMYNKKGNRRKKTISAILNIPIPQNPHAWFLISPPPPAVVQEEGPFGDLLFSIRPVLAFSPFLHPPSPVSPVFPVDSHCSHLSPCLSVFAPAILWMPVAQDWLP